MVGVETPPDSDTEFELRDSNNCILVFSGIVEEGMIYG
jgi:hypothetical protein